MALLHRFLPIALLLSSWCGAKDTHWDFLVYAQQWPESVCLEAQIEHSHQCSIPANISTWTIHGIWPSVPGGAEKSPSFCNDTYKFDPAQIESISTQLDQFWPNLYTDEPHLEFWEHEWSKHGTCAENLPSLAGEYNYFSKGLELNKKFELLQIMADAGITPITAGGSGYELSKIESALVKALLFLPKIYCYYVKADDVQYLIQIEICLDKTFSLIDCAKEVVSREVPNKGSLNNARLNSVATHLVKSFQLSKGSTVPCLSNVPVTYPSLAHVQKR